MSELKFDDLPLLSNTNEILVNHYILTFKCNFEKNSFSNVAIFFLEPVCNPNDAIPQKCICKLRNKHSIKDQLEAENYKTEFLLVLDCYKIAVDEIAEVDSEQFPFEQIKFHNKNLDSLKVKCCLNYIVDKWCLKIWKTFSNCRFCFPRVIKIAYKTVPDGPSLHWTKDQNGNPVVYVHGSSINNRSLFPCQDLPTALSTWEAVVYAEEPFIALMSGDQEAVISYENGLKKFYYFTKSSLPISTLALAIGVWEKYTRPKSEMVANYRIFAPPKLFNFCIKEFTNYIPNCIRAAIDLLGPYPFPRIDFLILPRGFGNLGMASPNIIYLSQSLIAGDSSMYRCVAHEISHAWFGLLIGASDCTSEWLTEGFATFLEDYIHLKAMNITFEEGKNFLELRTLIRHKILLYEIQNTEKELQVLRPNQGKTTTKIVDGVKAVILKNGQNSMKSFMQVHYLKGFFLLKHLSNLVGIDSFMLFLQDYVKIYQGQFVESQDVFSTFLQRFPEIENNLKIEDIYRNWLHSPGVPNELKKLHSFEENNLYTELKIEIKKWNKINTLLLKKPQKKKMFNEGITHLIPEQKVLLLESLLEKKKLSTRTLHKLDQLYIFDKSNAEIQHRWCELVVKHKYKPGYDCLRNFLKEHLGMGIYLYGELFFSHNRLQKTLVKECYAHMRPEIEPNLISAIDQMLQNCKA